MNLGTNISDKLSNYKAIFDYNQFSQQIYRKVNRTLSPNSVLVRQDIVNSIIGVVCFLRWLKIRYESR